MRAAGVGVLVAGAAAVLAACGSSGSDADVVAGKQLFVSKCGACHTLGRAGTKGTVGPNLDQAFQQAIKDGMGRDGIEGAVKEQIAHPARAQPDAGGAGQGGPGRRRRPVHRDLDGPRRPGHRSAGRGGQEGRRRRPGGGQGRDAGDRHGQDGPARLRDEPGDRAAGKLTVESRNQASIPHDIVIDGKGNGAEVTGGGVSKFTATFAKGTYTFYCSVPGHRQAGMEGKLTVR